MRSESWGISVTNGSTGLKDWLSLEDNGNALLIGRIVDQAELYGALSRAHDLGLSLIAVNCIETNDM
ncbi:MAG: hypothetical protein R3E39_29380 [Anaerolineae bacterium]